MMMTNRTISRRVDTGALVRAPFAAMQWRLLVLWTLLLLLPTAVVALPLWGHLASLLDHSIHAPEWAAGFSPLMFGDTLQSMSGHTGWLGGAGLFSLLLIALMSPFLTGMAVGAGRAGRTLGFGHLLQCGVVEYGRMFRLMLWSILPYAVMGALIGMLFGMADEAGSKAVLQSEADHAGSMAMFGAIVLFVLAQSIVESGRAAFIADGGLRSATRAIGRGFMQLLRRPISTLLSYLLITAIGYAIAAAIGVGRVNTPAIGAGGLSLALLLTQLAVLVMGWVRVARLFALAEVGRSVVGGSSRVGMPGGL